MDRGDLALKTDTKYMGQCKGGGGHSAKGASNSVICIQISAQFRQSLMAGLYEFPFLDILYFIRGLFLPYNGRKVSIFSYETKN